ncbi:MAG TPA: sialidase family protein, partial [Casimicrobiaceae bacterium]
MIVCALLVAGCGGGGGDNNPPAPPPPAGDPQFRVSGLSPFAAGCDGAPAFGTLYVNAEVEPMVAVNPRNANNVVGVWQQDRWSTGGSEGLLTGVSQDGGRTWSQHMAAFSRCTGGNAANGGDYSRASDPWVTFAPDGTVYQSSLSFNGNVLAAGSSSAILVSRSTDGGATWSNPTTLIRDGQRFFNDKDSITADSTDTRLVYAVWDRLDNNQGPSYFSRTTDGGISWEVARAIYDPGANSQTINNQIVVLPDGTLIDFFTRLDLPLNAPATATLAIIRSADKGVTWSVPIVISPAQSIGTIDPETRASIRDGSSLGSIAVGPHGELAVVWQDSRFSGGARDGVAFSRSLDGGLTWTTAIRVNRAPDVPAFVPAVTVRADGTYGVSYYDFRNNTADASTLLTDYWLARSADGVTWLESHITGPFDLALAPNAEGLFLGDYQALTSIGTVFVPFYVQTNTGNLANRTDVFSTLASSAGSANAARAGVEAPGMQSRATPPLAMTPELRQILHDSVM